jgi:hypothetical protein
LKKRSKKTFARFGFGLSGNAQPSPQKFFGAFSKKEPLPSVLAVPPAGSTFSRTTKKPDIILACAARTAMS